YRFPHIKESAVNSFEPDVNLKTEEQLENEDRINNGVKLEELIRKGTPSALAEANEMMKLMSGYDTSKKPDYKKEVNSEIERIESKVILLNDMLNQKSPEELKRKKDTTVEELHSSAKVAQSRLQKFIEENEDEDRMSRLLELNDLINTVLQKYTDLKSGKEVQKNSFDRKITKGQTSSSEKEAGGFINLIDFDDVQPAGPNTSASPQPAVFDPFSSMSVSAPAPQAKSVPQGGSLLGDLEQLSFGAPQQHFAQPIQGSSLSQGFHHGMQSQSAQHSVPLGNGFQHNQSLGGFGASQPMYSSPAPQSTAQPFDDLFAPIVPKAAPAPLNALAAKPAAAQNAPGGNDLLGLFNGNGVQPHQAAVPSNIQNGAANQPNKPALSQMSAVPAVTKENILFNKNGLQIKLIAPSPTNLSQINAQAVFQNITPV
ncbi:hypothetical protein HDU91_002642, partial [Kappamyces sp. JEL0680]